MNLKRDESESLRVWRGFSSPLRSESQAGKTHHVRGTVTLLLPSQINMGFSEKSIGKLFILTASGDAVTGFFSFFSSILSILYLHFK